jgi:ATPase subunit of ABC transporter with duplicated ATPase domains
VVVGELGQDRSAFDASASVLDAFIGATGLVVSEARSLFAKFGLGAEQVGRPARSLSPGERTRAELASFQARGVNLLVLDEPTNHLDLESINALNFALQKFEGTIFLVTHDHDLLEETATRIWSITPQGLEDFRGTYEEFQKEAAALATQKR